MTESIELHVCPMMHAEDGDGYTLYDGRRQKDVVFIDIEVQEYLPTGEIDILEEVEQLPPAQEPLGSHITRLEEKYNVTAQWLDRA